MDIRKVKVTLLAPEGDGRLPHPMSTMITDEAGNQLCCRWPVDIHIDADGCFVTLRIPAELEVEGQNFNEAVIRAVKKARLEKKI